MRPLGQVVRQIGSRYAIEMLQAEEHEVIQALAPQRAEEPLHEGLTIRSTNRRAHDFNASLFQRPIEGCRKLSVPVVLNVLNPQPTPTSLVYQRLGLSHDPDFVGMKRGGRQDDAPGFDVQEGKDERLANSLGRQDFLAEEFALRQG